MKKIKLLLCYILIIIMLPIHVFADCGQTVYKDYKVKVTNTEGAYIYDYVNLKYVKTNKKLNFNDVVKVTVDVAKFEDGYLLETDKGIIKSTDVTHVKDLSTDNNIKLYESDFYTTQDVEVRKGPGYTYEVAGTIKSDTKLKLEKEAQKITDLFAGADLYIRENGDWIYVSDGTVSGYLPYDYCHQEVDYIGKKVLNDVNYYIAEDMPELGLKYGDKIYVKYISDHVHYNMYTIEVNGKNYAIRELSVSKLYDETIEFLKLDSDFITLRDISDNSEVDLESVLELNKEYNVKFIFDLTDGAFPGPVYYLDINNKHYRAYITQYNHNNGDKIELSSLIKVTSKEVNDPFDINTDSEKNEDNEKILQEDDLLITDDYRIILFYGIIGGILLSAFVAITIVLINKKSKKNKISNE